MYCLLFKGQFWFGAAECGAVSSLGLANSFAVSCNFLSIAGLWIMKELWPKAVKSEEYVHFHFQQFGYIPQHSLQKPLFVISWQTDQSRTNDCVLLLAHSIVIKASPGLEHLLPRASTFPFASPASVAVSLFQTWCYFYYQ